MNEVHQMLNKIQRNIGSGSPHVKMMAYPQSRRVRGRLSRIFPMRLNNSRRPSEPATLSPHVKVADGNWGMSWAYKLYSASSERKDFYPADYFILMRPDLILKQPLFGYWSKAKDSVAFPFRERCSYGQSDSECRKDSMELTHPRCYYIVPDRLIAMPRHALETVRHTYGELRITHGILRDIVNVNDSWISKHIVFWLDEEHESNTERDRNPFYDIAGRKTSSLDTKCRNQSKGEKLDMIRNTEYADYSEVNHYYYEEYR